MSSLIFPALLLGALSAAAEPAPFDVWLQGVKAEAKKRRISEEAIAALDGVQPIEKVLELDRSQAEKRFTFEEYRQIVLSEERVSRGRELFALHREALEEVAKKYRVHPEFVVALWGVESKYGTITGSYPVLGALATLAYDGRRATFFRGELFSALKILEQGHVPAERMLGSWAGAMGQCQFMPSTFLAHAADFEGDGRKDIWGNPKDVFASAARYLSKLGWKRGEPWGYEVTLPEKARDEWFDKKLARTNGEWRKLGVKQVHGGKLEPSDRKATLVRPGGPEGPAYLVHSNFHALLRWNRSKYFATGVGLLSEAIKAPAPAVP